MTDLASPVIQVVTSGVDWPAVVAGISGGVVGLAGITFAWRQSRMTIRADDRRVELAEKRRIYANCLAALQHAADAGVMRDDPPSEREDAAAAAAETASFEVVIIAPSAVSKLVSTALGCLGEQREEEFSDAMTKLIVAMRVDLPR